MSKQTLENVRLVKIEGGWRVHFDDAGQFWDLEATVRERSATRAYVSFWYDGSRWWAPSVGVIVNFTAKRIKDKQYVRGGRGATHATQVRLSKIGKSTRNRHAKSLY